MDGLFEFIKQKYSLYEGQKAIRGPLYSEMYFLQSNAAGVLINSYASQGARAILINQLYFIAPVSAGICTLYDQFNVPMIQFYSTSSTAFFPIMQINDGPNVSLNCGEGAAPNVIFQFSISLQFIY